MADAIRVDVPDSSGKASDQREIPPVDPAKKAAEAARPEWLPPKFSNAEQLASAYTELEKKLGAPAPKDTKEPEQSQESPQIKPAELGDAFLTKFENEFADKGALSETSYQELQAKGYSKRHVDAYIAGIQAQSAQAAQSVYNAVGGQQKFEEMAQWAGSNLPAERQAQLNALLAQGGENAVIAAKALQSDYVSKVAQQPNLLATDGPSVGDTSTYETYNQLMTDMGSPLYKADEAYRRRVAAKLQRSQSLL